MGVFVRFSVAEVLGVSTVAVEGRAVVMVVSCWPASVAAEVSLVSKSPCGCAMCAKKFALRDLVWARARKSSPCMPKMAEKRCFQARWANFFAEMPLDGPRRANFFAEMPLEALSWATFVAVVLVVLAVGLRHPRRELRWVQCPWHWGVFNCLCIRLLFERIDA